MTVMHLSWIAAVFLGQLAFGDALETDVSLPTEFGARNSNAEHQDQWPRHGRQTMGSNFGNNSFTETTRSAFAQSSSGKKKRKAGRRVTREREDLFGDTGDLDGAEQFQFPTFDDSPAPVRRRRPRARPGFSGDVIRGKSVYVLKHNGGVPTYGFGEPYYYDYYREFPIAKSEWDHIVNSHHLPKRYKFSGSLNLLNLLDSSGDL